MLVGREQDEHIHRCPWPNVGPVPEGPFIRYILDKITSYGDKTSLVCGVSGETISFNELNAMVRKISHGWKNGGLKAGDVVCIVSPNSILTPPTILAAAVNCAPVTLANPLSTPDELRRHITDSKAKWLVVHPACLPTANAATKDLDGLKGTYVLGKEAANGLKPVCSLQEDAPEDWTAGGVSDDGVVLIPYSSGTTGLPKGVNLSSTNWLAVLSTAGREEYLKISSNDVILGILPFFHSFGIGICLSSLTYGATLVVLPRFIPDIFLNAIQVNKVTLLPIVPTLAIFMAKNDLVKNYDLSSVTSVICGAAPLKGEVQQLLASRLSDVTVRQGFGMTETTLACFSSDTAEMGAVGRVAAHVEAKMVDMETGDSLGPDQEGELCVRGAVITKGYLNNTEATTGLIDSAGWLHTGDVGHYNEKGVFFINDRIKELIKYKGFQVSPSELEGLLVTHEAVADAAVVGVKDEVAGELPKAYLVSKPGHTIVPEELVEWVKEKVAPHKRLRGGVEIIDAIPRSAAGKILRRKLKEKTLSV